MGGQEGVGMDGIKWNRMGGLPGRGPGALGVVLGMGGSGSAGRQPWKRPGVPRAVGRSPHKNTDGKPQVKEQALFPGAFRPYFCPAHCYNIFCISSATNCTLVPTITCTDVLLGLMTPATPADFIFFSSTNV